VVCARAYHALFMVRHHNYVCSLLEEQHVDLPDRRTEEELANFGEPDFIIYNAGQFPANRFTKGMSFTTSVEINFKRMKMVILGTEYADEMKKGVFSVMHYLQPVKFGQLSLHSSANVGMDKGDVIATGMEKRSPSQSVQQSVARQTTLRAPVAVARLPG
ncbi:PEP carboxykinase N-terminal domain-containing protein, partial [Rhizopogon salebrosus TDB-379]